MVERREHEIRAVEANRAYDVARLAGDGVGALHEREVAVGRGAQERCEIRPRVIGDAHRAPRFPGRADKVRSSQPLVAIHATVLRRPRSSTWAPPPKA